MLPKIKTFLINQSLYPFEVMWAFVCMFAGMVAILNYGITVTPLETALGITAATIFNVIFFISGAAIFLGVGFRKGNVEAFGAILLVMSLLVRTIAAMWLVGFTPMTINGFILNTAFIVACVVRLWTIWGWAKAVNQILHK